MTTTLHVSGPGRATHFLLSASPRPWPRFDLERGNRPPSIVRLPQLPAVRGHLQIPVPAGELAVTEGFPLTRQSRPRKGGPVGDLPPGGAVLGIRSGHGASQVTPLTAL